jgi:hypothetical protein
MFGDDIEHVKKVAQAVTETAIACASENMELVVGDTLQKVTEAARGLLAEQDGWTIDINIPAFKISVRLSKPKSK